MSLVSKEAEHPEQQFQKNFICKNHNISTVGMGYKMIGHNISVLDQTWATIVSSLKFPRNTIKTLTLPTNFICLSLGTRCFLRVSGTGYCDQDASAVVRVICKICKFILLSFLLLIVFNLKVVVNRLFSLTRRVLWLQNRVWHCLSASHAVVLLYLP